METEIKYVESLSTIKEVFMDPLFASPPKIKNLISLESIKPIFSNIIQILEVHITLKEELQRRISNWSPTQSIGDVILQNSTKFHHYTQYIKGFEAADQALKKCMENKSFAKFIHEAHTNPRCHLLELSDFLIMPVQRLPRYELLLKELLEFTEKDNKDSRDLQAALEYMKEIVNFVNEKKKEHDSSERLHKLKDKISSKSKLNLLTPGRLLIREGPLVQIGRKYGIPKDVYLFLFNDSLMSSKASKDKEKKFEFLAIIDLRFCIVQDLEPNEVVNLKLAEPKDFYFKLNDTRGKFYIFKAENAMKAQAWKADFLKAVDLAKTQIKIPQSYNEQVKQQLNLLKSLYSKEN